jgi:hypothetical protein
MLALFRGSVRGREGVEREKWRKRVSAVLRSRSPVRDRQSLKRVSPARRPLFWSVRKFQTNSNVDALSSLLKVMPTPERSSAEKTSAHLTDRKKNILTTQPYRDAYG